MRDPADLVDREDLVDQAHDLVLAHGPDLDRRDREDSADHGRDRGAHLRRQARLRGRNAHLPRDADAAGNSIRRPRKAQ